MTSKEKPIILLTTVTAPADYQFPGNTVSYVRYVEIPIAVPLIPIELKIIEYLPMLCARIQYAHEIYIIFHPVLYLMLRLKMQQTVCFLPTQK